MNTNSWNDLAELSTTIDSSYNNLLLIENQWNQLSHINIKYLTPFTLQDIRDPEKEGTGEVWQNIPLYTVLNLGKILNTRYEQALLGEGLTPVQIAKAGFVTGWQELTNQGYGIGLMDGKFTSLQDLFNAVINLNIKWKYLSDVEKDIYKNLHNIVITTQKVDSIDLEITLKEILNAVDPIPQEARLMDQGLTKKIADKKQELLENYYSDKPYIEKEIERVVERLKELNSLNIFSYIFFTDLIQTELKTLKDELEILQRNHAFLRTRIEENIDSIRKFFYEEVEGGPEFLERKAINTQRELNLLDNIENDFAGYADAETILAGEQELERITKELKKERVYEIDNEFISAILEEPFAIEEIGKIIISGSRNFDNYSLVKNITDKTFKNLVKVKALAMIKEDPNLSKEEAFSKAQEEVKKVQIFSGTARGADRLGEQYAEQNNIVLKKFPADWDTHGKKAGYLRNEAMALEADALIAFWDGDSPGTSHMIDLAKAKGIPIKVYDFTGLNTFKDPGRKTTRFLNRQTFEGMGVAPGSPMFPVSQWDRYVREDSGATELQKQININVSKERKEYKAVTTGKRSTSVQSKKSITSIDNSLSGTVKVFLDKAIKKLKLKSKIKVVTLSSLKENIYEYSGFRTRKEVDEDIYKSVEEPVLINPNRTEEIKKAMDDPSNMPTENRILEESQLLFRDTDLLLYDESKKEKRERVTKEIDDSWKLYLKNKLETIISDSKNSPAQLLSLGNERLIIVNDSIFDSPKLNKDLQDTIIMNAIGHELGHVFFDEEIVNLFTSKEFKDVNLKNKLWAKFKADRKDVQRAHVSQYKTETFGKPGESEAEIRAFEEWYADNVASFLLDDAKKATNGIEAYFKKIADIIKRFFGEINKFFQGRLYEIPETVEIERNGIKERVSVEKLIRSKVRASRADMRTEGVISGKKYDSKLSVTIDNFDNIFSGLNKEDRDSILFKYHIEQVLDRQTSNIINTKINDPETISKTDLVQRSIALDEIQEKVTTLYATKIKKHVETIQKSGSMKRFNRYLNTVTNWYRSIGGEVGDEIAAFWNPKSQSKERSGIDGETMGFHRSYGQMKNIFINQLKKATGVDLNSEKDFTAGPAQDAFLLNEDETLDTDKIIETVEKNPKIIKRLENSELSPEELKKEALEIAERAVKIRNFFQESIWKNYITYVDSQGVVQKWFDIGRRKNFGPRTWDWKKVEENPGPLIEIFIEHLDDINTEEQAKALIAEYINAQNENGDVVKYATLELETISDEWMVNYEFLRKYVEENQRLPNPSLEGKWAEQQIKALLNGQLPNQEAIELLEAIPGMIDRFGFSPGMKSALARKLGKIPTKVLREAGYLVDPSLATIQYIHHVTRKVEFERRGGYAYLDSLVNQLPEEDRESVRESFRGQLGQWGANMKPWMRNLNSAAALHTVMTTLLFVTISSITDPAGIITRSKDGSFKLFGEFFSQIKNTLSKDDNLKLAEAVGIVSAEALDTLFLSVGELDYASKWARTGMEKWFKYTGLTWYTRFTRILATGMGREFILETSRKYEEAVDGSIEKERLVRYLEEIGLTPEDAAAFKTFVETNDADTIAKFVSGTLKDSEGNPIGEPELALKIRTAIGTFADESIIRPNPGERPNFANHPYAAIVWMLKSYFYSFGTTVMGGMLREGKNRFSEDGHFKNGALLAVLAAGTMLPLAAIGLELRELTKYTLQSINPFQDASGRVFRSDYMDSPAYFRQLIDRSGIPGPWALLIQFVEAFKYGPTEPFTSIVPIIDAFDDTVIDGDAMRPWPILNNIQGGR